MSRDEEAGLLVLRGGEDGGAAVVVARLTEELGPVRGCVMEAADLHFQAGRGVKVQIDEVQGCDL